MTGIVLSVIPVGDYNRRVTILTKEQGKIAAFAQGARRPGNQFMGVTQPCVFGIFTLDCGRDSYNLREAKVENSFPEFRRSMEKSLYGMYFCEVAEYLTREGNDEREELKLLYASLRALENGKIPDRLVRAVFEYKTVCINGEGPLLSECIRCHKACDKGFFSLSGGMVCTECAESIPAAEKYELNESTWYAMYFVAATPPAKLFSFMLSEEVLNEFADISEKYLGKCTGHEFEGAELIRVIG